MLDAIDRLGSHAAAAMHLHRVPSAITHAVGKAEETLGFALFERVGRRARLTAAGRSLVEGGRPLLAAATQLECRAQQVASGWEAELTIALDALIPIERLFPLIADFHAAGHATEIRIREEVLAGCWDALLDGRADLAIGAPGDLPPGGGLAAEPLGSVAFVFAIAPTHPLAAAPEPLASETIRGHRAIVLADTTRRLAARSSGLLSGQPTLTVAGAGEKLAAQIAGLGVGYLPRHLALPAIAAGCLVERRTAEPRPPAILHLAWRSGQRGGALNWFIERLRDAATRRQLLPDAEP